MIIIPEKSLIFIHVPRTGGCSLSNALLSVFPKSFALEGTKHFPWLYICTQYPDYTGFGFIRNPYDRMISFYRYMKNNMKQMEFTHSFEQFLKEFSKVQSPLHGKFSSLLQKSYFENAASKISSNITILMYDSLELGKDLRLIFSSCEAKQIQKYLDTHQKIGCYLKEYFTWQKQYTCSWMLDVVYMYFQEDFECFGFDRQIK